MIESLKLLLNCFRFLISNTDHIIDVNQGTLGHQHDQINIVCPKYEAGTPNEVELSLQTRLLKLNELKCFPQTMERHMIYNVNKEEYDSCLITKRNPRIIAYCTNPMVGG